MAFYVLVLPAVENRLNRQRDDELMVYMQKLNSANQENDILAQENEDIEAKMAEVQEQLDTLTTGNTSIIAQYQSLIWCSSPTAPGIWYRRQRPLPSPALI